MLPFFLFAPNGAPGKKVTSQSRKYLKKMEKFKDFLSTILIHVSRRIS